MIKLSRPLCRAAYNRREPVSTMRPMQLGCFGCPWKTAIASMLLCRTRREQADRVMKDLFRRWPDPESMCRADGVEAVVMPLGLWRNRARMLTRFSLEWLDGSWQDLRELSGVGTYVADAVSLFCFGDRAIQCTDEPLRKYAATYAGPEVYEGGDGLWVVANASFGFREFKDANQAVEAYRAECSAQRC